MRPDCFRWILLRLTRFRCKKLRQHFAMHTGSLSPHFVRVSLSEDSWRKGHPRVIMNYLYEIFCTTATLYFAGTPYTFQIIPKGKCSYCCPLDPAKDITLHLSTKVNGPVEYGLYKTWGDDYFMKNEKPIVIYIHGFSEQGDGPNSELIKTAYMTRGEENLVIVDWTTLAALPWYDHAVDNTHFVAMTVADFIENLVHRGVSLDRIHVVGFSLGAEIAGQVGELAKSKVGKLSRITGLDPAMPLYLGTVSRGRLDADDAEFVDIIHTDGGILGWMQPIGHADFFPNGGKPAQPGCTIEEIVHENRIGEFVACSHNKAWKYFAESVMFPDHFPAVQCHSLDDFESGKCGPGRSQMAYMGYGLDPNIRGQFFLQTNKAWPFGRGADGAYYRKNLNVTEADPLVTNYIDETTT